MKKKIIISLFLTLLFYSSDLSAQRVVTKLITYEDGSTYYGETIRRSKKNKHLPNKWIKNGKGELEYYKRYKEGGSKLPRRITTGIWSIDTLTSGKIEEYTYNQFETLVKTIVYEGEFKNGLPSNGDYKEGGFENWLKFSGQIANSKIKSGTLSYKNYWEFEGTFSEDPLDELILEGCDFSIINRSEGIEGLTLTAPKDGVLSAYGGEYKVVNGEIVSGNKVSVIYELKGTYESGEIKEGTFIAKLQNFDFGYIDVNIGQKFIGTFKNGRPENGILYTTDDSKEYTVKIANGRYAKGKMPYKLRNGDYVDFEGELKNGQLDSGSIFYSSEYKKYEKFTGNFQNDLPSEGLLIYRDKSRFEGTFNKEGNPAKGIYKFIDGFYFKEQRPFDTRIWKLESGKGTFEGDLSTMTGIFNTTIDFRIQTDYKWLDCKFKGELYHGTPSKGTITIYDDIHKKNIIISGEWSEGLGNNDIWKKYLIKKYGNEYGSSLGKGYYRIGMTMDMCREVVGRYKVFSSSEYAGISYVTWVLPGDTLLYFENSVLKRFVN